MTNTLHRFGDAESFRDEAHLKQIQREAQNAIAGVFENVKAPGGG